MTLKQDFQYFQHCKNMFLFSDITINKDKYTKRLGKIFSSLMLINAVQV